MRLRSVQVYGFETRATTTPDEVYALLFGHQRGTILTVRSIIYPDMLITSPVKCVPDTTDQKLWLAAAELAGEEYLGTLHSHPGPKGVGVLSYTDYRSMLDFHERVSLIFGGAEGGIRGWQPNSPLGVAVEFYDGYEPPRKKRVRSSTQGERLACTQEVAGSMPAASTTTAA